MSGGSTVFASGADERYGYHLVNLLGSLQVNSDVFDRIVAFDLGLSREQRALLDDVRGVEVRTVPAFAAHWSQGFAWKPWIWTHLDAGEDVFWLDAGSTLLRSLEPALQQIRKRGYFVVSQDRRLRELVPSDYWDLYALDRAAGDRDYVAAGIVGFRVGSPFYERVIVPTYEDCLAGRSLGFSPDEAPALNRGMQSAAAPILRDAKHFRWDQTILNIHLAKELPDAYVNDVWEYAGWRSPRDHPRQVIWNHRRHGDMAYLWRAPSSPRLRAFGLLFRARWWYRMHRKYFTSTTYVLKARRLLAGLRRSPASDSRPSAPS
jgi:hypothetical protein